MSMISGIRGFFGLDIGTTGLRVVQLTGIGETKNLMRYGYMPIDGALAESDAPADQQKLAQAIKHLVTSAGITTNNVTVGLPSSKVFTTLVDIDRLNDHEIYQTIKLQADALIPTPVDSSKYDWAVVGDSPLDPTKVEVLLSSVSNPYIEARLDMLEAIGLNVIAFEPETMAVTRALIPEGSSSLTMVLDIGNKSTDLVVSMDGSPRLTRSIATGTKTLLRVATQNLNIDEKQAEQFVFKFGLSKDKLEGQIHGAIIGTIDVLMGEVEKSLNFIKSRYPNIPIERIVLTGGASNLPELPLYIANRFGKSVEIGNAWRNVAFPPEKQNELMAVSSHFAVAVGLAERDE